MITVLIVEDDPMVREINQKFLEKIEGFQLIDSVNSIQKAKDSIVNNKPELVLLDVFFPKERGHDLLKWIRINDIKCDVILITADRNTDTVEEAFRFGAVDYLIKPFTFNRLKEALLQYKMKKDKLKSLNEIDQEVIDNFILNEQKLETQIEDDTEDNKNFNKHTYDKVFNIMKDMKDRNFTAQQVSKLIGVSRITARRYLDLLEKEGKVIIELEYGQVGRPKNKYKYKPK